MLASSKTMRDILSNHLVDVQSMGPDRKPWRFNGPWEIYGKFTTILNQKIFYFS